MTELDLGLKCGARALLWTMGYSTRLDVELRGDARAVRGAGKARTAAPETFTDLDVLGVLLDAGYQLTTTIADCKSGQRDKSTARMFWARGVADLFGADQVMLVREHDVNDATRQLSSKLGITVLPTDDLVIMQGLHGPPIPDDSPLAVMFDRAAVEKHLAAFDGLDRRLKPLLEYRQFDYWVYETHRNLVQLIAHVRDAASTLDVANPIHLGLFFDLVWLYLLSLVKVTQHVRGAFLRDPDRGLQEYLFGGATGLREKQETAALLRSVAPKGTQKLDHLPSYYPNLRELVMRLLRRPGDIQRALRYTEAASALTVARTRVTLKTAFGAEFEPIAAKLAADVAGFLVSATGLPGEFRTQARAYLLSEPVHQGEIVAATSASEPAAGMSRAAQPDPAEPAGLIQAGRPGSSPQLAEPEPQPTGEGASATERDADQLRLDVDS